MKLRRTIVTLGAVGVMFASTAVAQAALPVKPTLPVDPFAGATVTELVAPKPDWYTDRLHAEVVAAAETGEGVELPEDADIPASGLAFTGIRPGSWIISPAGCTTNFVFGSEGNYSIGTAGHCTERGDEVTIVAAPGILMNIGTTVRSVDNGVGEDFALIDIRPEMQQYVNPSMTHFGGPTGVGDPQFGDLVAHSGHGLVIGTGGTPRAGVVVYRGPGDAGDAFAWDGAAAPGDSGSAVRDLSGPAAGNLTHLVVGGPYVPGVIAGTTIARMLQLAGKPLATAPAIPDPLY